MLHSIIRATTLVAVVISLTARGFAQVENAYEMLPRTTQASLWIPDSDLMLNGWNRTELSKLATDDKVAPFFRERRAEIEKRFMEAGWRLSIQPEDLSEFATGELLLAWTSVENPRKPFTLLMLADVEDNPQANAKLLEEIDTKLRERKAEKASLEHSGTPIIKYVLPRQAGEIEKATSFLAIRSGKLFVADDEAMIKEILDRSNGTRRDGDLASDDEFVRSRELAEISGEGHVEFFVRPLGFARIIRAIAGKESKSNTDMLVALEKEGFGAIRCISGEITFGAEELDINYKGFVFAKKPFALSAEVLDFPNEASHEIPRFVGENIASMLVTNWNARDAFWKVEGLVDELAGTEGVFAEVIEGIKKDPNGPQLDIRKLLPLFTNDIYSVAETKAGEADVDSRRNMLAFRLTDPATLSRDIDHAMEREPDAERIDYKGHTIWLVSHNADNSIDFGDDEFGDEFADFAPAPAQAQQENHWLSIWAISVYDNYLIFASHAELIQEAIDRGRSVESSPLIEQVDYQRVLAAISKFHGDDPVSAWRVLFPKQAYRIQYELFRQGKLSESQSMLASILDRLLQKSEKAKEEVQRINGQGLPAFETIEKYLQPGGFSMRTAPDGWSFGGMVLGKNATDRKKKGGNAGSGRYDTARTLEPADAARR